MRISLWAISANLLLGTLFTACSETSTTETPNLDGYTIDVNISNTSMDSAFLFELGQNGWELKESVTGDSGKFHFEGQIAGANYIAIGDKKRNYSIRLMAENKPIQIVADYEKPGKESITGSSSHVEYLAVKDSMLVFSNTMDSLLENYNLAENADDTAAMQVIESEYYLQDALKDKWLKNWVKENPKSYVAQFFMINPISYQSNSTELRALFNGIAPEVNNSQMYATLHHKLEILEKSAVGQMAPDFTMNDTDGNPVTLSSQFGNYLLIDFWASWCGPCRLENPHMVELYHQYHSKGYDIFGVSLDREEDKWLAAIEKDNLTWKQVSDLGFWDNAAAKLYGVSSIPHTVLIDPQGKIIARGLSGDELAAKLAEIFTSKAQ